AVEIAASAEMLTKIENMAGTKGREIADGIRAKQKEKADMKALDEAQAKIAELEAIVTAGQAQEALANEQIAAAQAAVIDAEGKIDTAYDEGMNAGVTAERIRVAALIEKYGPEFAAAHIGKTDEDVQAAWLAHLASGTAPVETDPPVASEPETFQGAVRAKIDEGMTRGDAISWVATNRPDLQAAYIAARNRQ
ncbi:MAG TPA: hypothetical protein VM487_01575, partial [Phycisphaerae bacterium]|nr:hypothetical protein [Phycisphaerae bacterium]